jgi:hypothetical protein
MRATLLRVLLWWAVLAWGTWVGGTLFHMLVVVPLWSESAAAARAFFGGTGFNATIGNFFGPPWMAARVLPVFAALAVAWPLPRHRRWLLVAAVAIAAAVAFTFAYVYPINDVLFTRAGAGLGDAEVERLVQRWISADRARFAVGVVGWIALLAAFRLPAADAGRR